jgi:uncharacterized protein
MTSMHTYRVPADVLRALSEGGGGAAAVDYLAGAQYSKHVLLIRQVVESAWAAGHQQAPQASEAYDVLAAVQQRDPSAVDAVLRHPPVAAWARLTIRALADEGTRRQASPGRLAALAVATAIRSGQDWSAELPVADSIVMVPSLGCITVPARSGCDRVRIRVTRGRAVAAGDGWQVRLPSDPSVAAAGWQGLRPLSAAAAGRQLHLLIEDLDPHRMPGHRGVSPRLSQAEWRGWQSVLDNGWDLLARWHQTVADEIAAAVRVFTPLLPPQHGQVSATSRDTFGTVALSPPPDACSLAVTLAHETQHAKLSALLDLVALLPPDDSQRYYAPWRDDPRPLSGLLQGAYAFLGVAAFWQRQRTAAGGGAATIHAHTEFARWRDAVSLVTSTLLASGRLTGQGREFVTGMVRTLSSWEGMWVPQAAAQQARSLADAHRARWLRDHAATAGCGVPA